MVTLNQGISTTRNAPTKSEYNPTATKAEARQAALGQNAADTFSRTHTDDSPACVAKKSVVASVSLGAGAAAAAFAAKVPVLRFPFAILSVLGLSSFLAVVFGEKDGTVRC